MLFIRFEDKEIWEVEVLLISLSLSLYSISGFRKMGFVRMDSVPELYRRRLLQHFPEPNAIKWLNMSDVSSGLCSSSTR